MARDASRGTDGPVGPADNCRTWSSRPENPVGYTPNEVVGEQSRIGVGVAIDQRLPHLGLESDDLAELHRADGTVTRVVAPDDPSTQWADDQRLRVDELIDQYRTAMHDCLEGLTEEEARMRLVPSSRQGIAASGRPRCRAWSSPWECVTSASSA